MLLCACLLTTLMPVLFLPEAAGIGAAPDLITTVGTCTCVTSDGTEYSLEPLKRTDGQPRFNVRGERYTSWNYTYNPCIPVTLPRGSETTTCHNSSICRLDPNAEYYQGLGRQYEVYCSKTKEGVIELVYNIQDPLISAKTSRVLFVCEEKRQTIKEAEFQPENEDLFTFAVIHRCACPNGCPSTVPPATVKTSPPPTTAANNTPVTPAPQKGGTSCPDWISMPQTMVSLIALAFMTVLALVFCCCCCCRRRGNNGDQEPLLGNRQAGEEAGRRAGRAPDRVNRERHEGRDDAAGNLRQEREGQPVPENVVVGGYPNDEGRGIRRSRRNQANRNGNPKAQERVKRGRRVGMDNAHGNHQDRAGQQGPGNVALGGIRNDEGRGLSRARRNGENRIGEDDPNNRPRGASGAQDGGAGLRPPVQVSDKDAGYECGV